MNKTWFIDIDGTLVKHLDNKDIAIGAKDEVLPYAKEFVEGIKKRGDIVVLATARPEEFRGLTLRMLKRFGIEFDHILFDMGHMERVVVNDVKPEGIYDGGVRDQDIPTAYAVNMVRDEGFGKVFEKNLWKKPESAKERVFDLFDLRWFYSGIECLNVK
jgi:ribonucleotide monophosphatase NagD (HAD superfamily)